MLVTLDGISGAEVKLEQLRKVLVMSVTLMAFDMSGAEVRLEQLRKVVDMLVTLAGISGAEIKLLTLAKASTIDFVSGYPCTSFKFGVIGALEPPLLNIPYE